MSDSSGKTEHIGPTDLLDVSMEVFSEIKHVFTGLTECLEETKTCLFESSDGTMICICCSKTNHPNTTRTVSINELIVGVGLATGPGLGGFLAERDMHLPYWFNLGLVVLLVVVQLALRATLLGRNGEEADASHWSAAARESVQPGAALSYRPGEDQ